MRKNSLAIASLMSIGAVLMEQANDGATAVSTGTPGTADAGKTKKPEIKEVPIPAGMRGEIFHFRKEKVKDENGVEIGEAFKHPSIMVPLPIPTKEEVLAIMTAPSEGEGSRASEQKYILDLIADAFYGQARDQINEYREQNPKAEVSAQILDYNKLTINALANMPASERGNKISDEDMTAFLADYVAVMPQKTGKEAVKIKAQAAVLEKQLRTVRTDKKVLDVMDKLLAMWANENPNLEEHQAVYDFLTGRIKRWLAAEPKNVLESIL